jgi:hypothetical protein
MVGYRATAGGAGEGSDLRPAMAAAAPAGLCGSGCVGLGGSGLGAIEGRWWWRHQIPRPGDDGNRFRFHPQ